MAERADQLIDPKVIAEALRRHVESYTPETEREEVGRVLETGDGIARVLGLQRMKPSTCPVCSSERLIIVLREDRKGVCCDCGSQWLETILGERMVVAVPKRSSEAEPR